MVAFHPVTNPKDDEWRAMAIEFVEILDAIQAHERKYQRPPGEEWPALAAALGVANKVTLWELILFALRGCGRALTAQEVLQEVSRLKRLSRPVTLRIIQNRLSQGASADEKRWVAVSTPGGAMRYAAHEFAPPGPVRDSEDRAARSSPRRS